MLVNGVRLVPEVSGALWWPGERMLIAADLHLEKGSSYAARSRQMLPPYDTRATIGRLEALMRRYQPATVLCLGDSFHDRDAAERLAGDDRARLGRLVDGTRWLWITGNHDPEVPADLGGERCAEFRHGGLVFRHEPQGGRQPGEVAGHLHPKAAVSLRGRRVARRCFVTDGSRLILPAFGAYAGGLCVFDQAFFALFRRSFHAWLLGDSQVHPIAAPRLQPV